jgi:hypothetical protein
MSHTVCVTCHQHFGYSSAKRSLDIGSRTRLQHSVHVCTFIAPPPCGHALTPHSGVTPHSSLRICSCQLLQLQVGACCNPQPPLVNRPHYVAHMT